MTPTPKKSVKSPRWHRVRYLITLVAAAFLIAVAVNLVTGCGSTHNGGSTNATKPASTAQRLSQKPAQPPTDPCKEVREEIKEWKEEGQAELLESAKTIEHEECGRGVNARYAAELAKRKKDIAEYGAEETGGSSAQAEANEARAEAVKHEAEVIRRVKQAEGQIKELCSLTLHQVIVGMAGINPAQSPVDVQAEYETLCRK